MLSRIAESLYWMARHLERADNTARVLDINVVHRLAAEEGLTEEGQWMPLLTILDADERYAETYPDGRVSVPRVIQLLTQAEGNPGSILNSLRLARENARAVRDRISTPVWETIDALCRSAEDRLKATLPPWRAAEFHAFVHREVATVFGLAQGTMMRGEAHSFTRLGTLQERADMTARILDVRYHLLLPDPSQVGSPLDYYQWGVLLKSLSGFDAYRRLYQTGVRPVDVIDFVILNPDFPRSLVYCISRMERALERIGQRPDGEVGSCLDRLHTHLDGVGAADIIAQGLHEYLDVFLAALSDLSDALTQDYFNRDL
jgi:uncharacterized alpha-E superfamily protein